MHDSNFSQSRTTGDPIGFHITLRLENDRPIATTTAALRTIARVVLTQGEARGLLAFGTADNHLHAELATERASAGEFARYVASSLSWRLGLGAHFERARIRPIHDQRHAYNTFHYVHRQDVRHDLDLDPAREGTSLPDLLGLRVIDASLAARVRTHLPRVRLAELAAQLPLDDAPAIDPDVLADAAAAAFALPDLRGRSAHASRARHAAVHAAAHAPNEVLSVRLGIGMRAVQALRTRPSARSVVFAVESQARLRMQLRHALAEPRAS